MPELRLRRVAILVAMVCGMLSTGCVEGSPNPLWEGFHQFEAGSQRFLVPVEHIPGDVPLPQIRARRSTYEEVDSESATILVHFSHAWLAAHVRGFQPILNYSAQPTTVSLEVHTRGEALPRPYPAIARSVWNRDEYWPEYVVRPEREPNTGLLSIQPVLPGLVGEPNRHVLTDTLPVEGEAFPEDPPWSPLVCSYRRRGLIERAGPTMRCWVFGHPREDIRFLLPISGENLRVRDEIVRVVGEEILRWQALAETHQAEP